MVNYQRLDVEKQQSDLMMRHLQKFQDVLEDPTIPHHLRQITQAAIVMLKEAMEIKTRDIKRRLRS